MKNLIYKIIIPLYSRFNRFIKPSGNFKLAVNDVEPMSRKFGIDRGTPVDRYYIEKYLAENKKYITGSVLEIGDDRYTKMFGENVTKSDILDINKNNKVANIHADLRRMPNLNNNSYDCIILTQVLGMVDDVNSVLSECYRILKPNGTLILTTSAISPQIDHEFSYWRFTEQSIRYLLDKKFKKIKVSSFGNAYVGQAIWVGMAQEDINKKFLEVNDRQFQCIVVAKATK